ncbi:hypothetical protein MMC14_008354 [Varicellaria rhodocarpa]|nr:hypothetical protein [Varicellaria rhodocarpa]
MSLVYRLRLKRSGDVTWDLLPIVTLIVAEVNIGIMCGCMPLLTKFFRHHRALPRLLKSLISAALNSLTHATSILTGRSSVRHSEGSLERIESKSSIGQRRGHLLTLGTSFRREEGLGLNVLSTARLEMTEKKDATIATHRSRLEGVQEV